MGMGLIGKKASVQSVNKYYKINIYRRIMMYGFYFIFTKEGVVFKQKSIRIFPPFLFLISLISVAHASEKWSYLVKTYPLMGDDSALSQTMNTLGAEGWELVNCAESRARLTCIYKRPSNEQ